MSIVKLILTFRPVPVHLVFCLGRSYFLCLRLYPRDGNEVSLNAVALFDILLLSQAVIFLSEELSCAEFNSKGVTGMRFDIYSEDTRRS
jgi:hypothetical protein